jgi:hypothetical protein
MYIEIDKLPYNAYKRQPYYQCTITIIIAVLTIATSYIGNSRYRYNPYYKNKRQPQSGNKQGRSTTTAANEGNNANGEGQIAQSQATNNI